MLSLLVLMHELPDFDEWDHLQAGFCALLTSSHRFDQLFASDVTKHSDCCTLPGSALESVISLMSPGSF